jgi:hypothetical protein
MATHTRTAAIILVMALASAAAAAPTWTGAKVYEGEHYRLVTDVDPDLGADLIKLLDAHYARLRAIFGKTPKHDGLLNVRLFKNVRHYRSAVGGTAGGIYTFRDSIANVWVQARAYWTRHLLLHETTHQWMHLTFTGNRAHIPWWLDEGFAEYCAFHVWDGKALRTELSDVITLMDYVTKAKTITAEPDYHLEKTFTGGLSGDRAEAWVLIHYLMHKDKASRRRLLKCLATVPAKVHVADKKKVDRAGREAFRRLVTSKLDRLTNEVKEYAAGLTRSWRVVTIAWDRRGDIILARAGATAVLAHVRETLGPTAEISFRYRVIDGKKGWIGLAHRIRDKDHFRVVTLTTPGSVLWNELGNGRWTRHGQCGKAVARDGEWHDVKIRFTEKTIAVSVDGKPLPALKRPAADALETVGLFVDACRAEFRNFVIVAP